MRPDQVGGLLLECCTIHAGELGPPPRDVRLDKLLDVENQHEPRQRILVLAQAFAQQRDGAGGLADSASRVGFVLNGLAAIGCATISRCNCT